MLQNGEESTQFLKRQKIASTRRREKRDFEIEQLPSAVSSSSTSSSQPLSSVMLLMLLFLPRLVLRLKIVMQVEFDYL